jgi:hypothetical protein
MGPPTFRSRPAPTPQAKTTYAATHIDPSSKGGRNGGAHLAYLAAFAARNPEWHSGRGHSVGAGLTAADVELFDVLDLHLRIFKEEVAEQVSGRS